MEKGEKEFFQIAARLSKKPWVKQGPMMSSPGIKYKNKVFAFYHKESMTFRLGDGYHLKKHGVKKHEVLSPFKTKPPLKDWLIVGPEYANVWEELAEVALGKMGK